MQAIVLGWSGRWTPQLDMRILRAIYNKAVHQHLVNQTFPFQNVYTGVERTRKRAVDEEVIMADWAKAQSSNGSWEEISSTVALKRIEVMNSYSYSFLDSRLDEKTRQAYDYYRTHISTRRGKETFISKERLQTLGQLYEIIKQGNACPMDWKLADKIAGIMAKTWRLFHL